MKDNVIYGSEESLKKKRLGPIEVEQYIERVLRKANVWEHFQDEKKFPQGLNTKCWNLSGGEKRSVGTARALLKTPSILLLDEPTEGLDASNEKQVMENLLLGRPKGQTVLAIAHRLSSLQDADMIIFVGKDGRIAETGTWQELLKIKDGKFAAYVKVQKLGGKGKTRTKKKKKKLKKGSKRTEDTDDTDDTENTEDMEQAGNQDDDASTTASLTSLSSEDSKSNESFQEGDDPIKRAMDAMLQLKRLAVQEDLPYDLITPLETACDNVLDYHRVSELATREAKFWLPYGMSYEGLRSMSYEALNVVNASGGGSGSGGGDGKGGSGSGIGSRSGGSPRSPFSAIPLKRVTSLDSRRKRQNRSSVRFSKQ